MKNINQLAVITGGTKGIGRAIIDYFAKAGYAIVTCSRNEEDLLKTKQEVESVHHVDIHIMKADLSIKADTLAFVSFINGFGKQVAVLVNNAGLFVPAPIHEEKDGLLERMISTNLYSAYHLCRGLIPEMKTRRAGHIFNLCSVASMKAYPTGGSYSISKFALYGLTKGLREETKSHGIKVTAVLPGATQTSSWEGEDIDECLLMKPEDIAKIVWNSFSLSDRSVVEDIVIRPQLGDI